SGEPTSERGGGQLSAALRHLQRAAFAGVDQQSAGWAADREPRVAVDGDGGRLTTARFGGEHAEFLARLLRVVFGAQRQRAVQREASNGRTYGRLSPQAAAGDRSVMGSPA